MLIIIHLLCHNCIGKEIIFYVSHYQAIKVLRLGNYLHLFFVIYKVIYHKLSTNV